MDRAPYATARCNVAATRHAEDFRAAARTGPPRPSGRPGSGGTPVRCPPAWPTPTAGNRLPPAVPESAYPGGFGVLVHVLPLLTAVDGEALHTLGDGPGFVLSGDAPHTAAPAPSVGSGLRPRPRRSGSNLQRFRQDVSNCAAAFSSCTKTFARHRKPSEWTRSRPAGSRRTRRTRDLPVMLRPHAVEGDPEVPRPQRTGSGD